MREEAQKVREEKNKLRMQEDEKPKESINKRRNP